MREKVFRLLSVQRKISIVQFVFYFANEIIVHHLSSDPGFLKQYPEFEADEDLMQWQIETRGTIEPEQCSFRLKPTNLELKLIKASTGKWESLESTTGEKGKIETIATKHKIFYNGRL